MPAARYFTEEFTLTQEHGSILDMWLKSGNTPALPRSAVAHLKAYIHPDYRFYTVTARPQLAIAAKLMANEIKLIQIGPVKQGGAPHLSVAVCQGYCPTAFLTPPSDKI